MTTTREGAMTTKQIKDYPYYVVRTAFHGGGVVSRHWSQDAANKSARRFAGDGSCACGCAVALAAEDYTRLPYAETESNPYAAARR
jgi:sugar (pentulose or hexulose) kinase